MRESGGKHRGTVRALTRNVPCAFLCTGALPFEIGKLTRLTTLNLKKNNLTELPSSVRDLTALTKLDVSGNSNLRTPPPTVVRDGLPAIKRYFDLLDRDGGGFESWVVKAVFVGQGEAGKTSLLRAAKARSSFTCDADARTIGVDIEKWNPEGEGDGKLIINTWDFAGAFSRARAAAAISRARKPAQANRIIMRRTSSS